MESKHTKGEWTAHHFGNISVIKEAGLLEKGYSYRIAELHEYRQLYTTLTCRWHIKY